MDLTLTRTLVNENGAFGFLATSDGSLVCYTAEHAYENPDWSWYAKIPAGQYMCQYGVHQLEVGPPFPTYQVLNVPRHTNILIHMGNLPESDSEGCILLGSQLGTLNGKPAAINSMNAFRSFMVLQDRASQFTLTVVDNVGGTEKVC